MKADFNPFHWSSDIKTIAGVITIAITIIGSAWKGASFVGEGIYSFAKGQTVILDKLSALQAQIVNENSQREKAINGLGAAVIPRVDKLEDAVHNAAAEAAAAKQKASDMTDVLRHVEDLATQNLRVSRSNSEDIHITREAVSPTPIPTP